MGIQKTPNKTHLSQPQTI